MNQTTDTARTAWQPQFDVYMTSVDGSPASFVLDMGVCPHVPVRGHPLRLQVRVRLLRPREDGLQDASELAAMGEVEDAISGRVLAALGGIYVGRFTCEGHATYVFYLPAEQAGRIDDLAPIIGDLGPYAWEWMAEDDPSWDYFTGFLYPDKLSFEAMANQKLLEDLESRGDRLEVPREIDHRAYFLSPEQAATAAAELQGLGYRTDEAKLVENPEPRWALDFHRVDTLANGRPDEFCAEILNVVLPREGTYDGWGTVITGAVP